MGSIKDRNGMDLTEAEDNEKRWQEYTEELYKKDLHNPVVLYCLILLSKTLWPLSTPFPLTDLLPLVIKLQFAMQKLLRCPVSHSPHLGKRIGGKQEWL